MKKVLWFSGNEKFTKPVVPRRERTRSLRRRKKNKRILKTQLEGYTADTDYRPRSWLKNPFLFKIGNDG